VSLKSVAPLYGYLPPESVPDTEGTERIAPTDGRNADTGTDWRKSGRAYTGAAACAFAPDVACGVAARRGRAALEVACCRARPWIGDLRTADMVGHSSVVAEAIFYR
jgi:hypothetical protein